jgi:hypothetical protein
MTPNVTGAGIIVVPMLVMMATAGWASGAFSAW